MLCSCLEASLLSSPRCLPLLSISFLDKRTDLHSSERSQRKMNPLRDFHEKAVFLAFNGMFMSRLSVRTTIRIVLVGISGLLA